MVGSTVGREGRRAPVRGEVDDLAHEHAGDRRPLEAAERRARSRSHGHHSISSPGEQDEDVLEVRGPALALGHAAVAALDAEHGDARPGAAGREAGGLRGGLGLGELRGRAVDLHRLAPGMLAPRAPPAARKRRAPVGHDQDRVREALAPPRCSGWTSGSSCPRRAARRSAPRAPGAPAGRARPSARRGARAAAGGRARGRSGGACASRPRACPRACRGARRGSPSRAPARRRPAARGAPIR